MDILLCFLQPCYCPACLKLIQIKIHPYGLKVDEIAPETKIIAYADIISVLMEDRPYRKGMNIDDTIQLMEDKIANNLGIEMFSVIKKNKTVLNQCVKQYQKESFNIYVNSNEL